MPHLQNRKRVSGFRAANTNRCVLALNDNFSLRGILNYGFCSSKKTKKRGVGEQNPDGQKPVIVSGC